MSDQLNKMKTCAGDALAQAGRAARLVAFISGRKMQILSHREHIRCLYTKLGRICYKDHITDEEPDEAEYKPIYDAISRRYRAINALREEIEAAKADYHAAGDELSDPEPPEDEGPSEEEEEMDFIPFEPMENPQA